MSTKTLIVLFIIIALCNQCEKGTDGINSLIRFEQNAPENICPSGGITVYTGLDLNNNNILESSEIKDSTHICNGNNALIKSEIEPRGENCGSGGFKVFTGIDLNSNGILDSNEVQDTVYICSGNNALIRTEIEPKGQNCEAGGYKIYSGTDINGDGYLNDSEIQDSSYLCHGKPSKQLIIGDISDPNLKYIDVDPDVEIWGDPYLTYDLDLNQDGKNDLQFISMNDYSPTFWHSYSKVKSRAGFYFSIIDTAWYPRIHQKDDVINNLNNWKSGEFLLAYYYTQMDTIWPWPEDIKGIWHDINQKFLAIRIINGSEIYYGWLKISIGGGTRIHEITLHEYAYK